MERGAEWAVLFRPGHNGYEMVDMSDPANEAPGGIIGKKRTELTRLVLIYKMEGKADGPLVAYVDMTSTERQSNAIRVLYKMGISLYKVSDFDHLSHGNVLLCAWRGGLSQTQLDAIEFGDRCVMIDQAKEPVIEETAAEREYRPNPLPFNKYDDLATQLIVLLTTYTSRSAQASAVTGDPALLTLLDQLLTPPSPVRAVLRTVLETHGWKDGSFTRPIEVDALIRDISRHFTW